jgi:hypothetical protein
LLMQQRHAIVSHVLLTPGRIRALTPSTPEANQAGSGRIRAVSLPVPFTPGRGSPTVV